MSTPTIPVSGLDKFVPKIRLWLFRHGIGKLYYIKSRRTIIWRLFG